MNANFEAYLKLDTTGYEGKYVVLVDGKAVGKGKDLQRILAQVKRQHPGKVPLIAKVPEEGMLIL